MSNQNLYAVSFSYFHDGKTSHKAGYICADSTKSATVGFKEILKEAYPECGGYLNHTVDVLLVRDEVLKNGGFIRQDDAEEEVDKLKLSIYRAIEEIGKMPNSSLVESVARLRCLEIVSSIIGSKQ